MYKHSLKNSNHSDFRYPFFLNLYDFDTLEKHTPFHFFLHTDVRQLPIDIVVMIDFFSHQCLYWRGLCTYWRVVFWDGEWVLVGIASAILGGALDSTLAGVGFVEGEADIMTIDLAIHLSCDVWCDFIYWISIGRNKERYDRENK